MERSTVQAVAFLAAECVSGLLSIACNLLVLLAIYRERSLQTVANCFIGSLALADFLVGLVIPPIYILIYLDIPNSYYGCVSMSCIALVMTDISLLNMSAIAVERFLAISRPYQYIKHITMRSAITSLLVICAAAILIGFFPLLMLLLPSKHGHVAINATYCPIQALPQKYLVYINFFSFYLPLMIFNFVAYTYILMTVKKHIRNIYLRKMTASRDTFFLSEDQTNTKRKEKRGAKRTILILIVLIVCVVPLKLSDCFMYFGHMELPCDLYLAFLVLSHTKSFINPYLYALTSSKFASEVARIMPCIKVSSSPEINFLRRRFSRKGRKGSLQGYWLFPFELDDLIFEDESTQSRIYGESSMAEYNEMGNSFVPVGNSPSYTSDLDIVEWMQSSIESYLHHDSNSFTSVRTFNAPSFAERHQRTNDSSISCTQDTPDNKIRDSSQSITELLTVEHSHDLVAAQSSRGGSMVDPLTLQSPQPDMFPDEVNGKASLPHTKPTKRSASEQLSHHQSQVYKPLPTEVKPPLTSARPTGNVHEDGTKRKFGTSHEHLTHIKITALAHLFHKKSFVKRSGDDLDQDANILGHSPKPPSASSVQKGPSLRYECPVTYDCSAYGSHVHFDAAVTEQRKKLISGVSEGKSKTGGRSAAEERKEDSGSDGLIANVLPKDAKKEKSTGQKPSVAFHSGVSHSLNFRQDDSRDKGTLRRTPARGAHGSLDSERITFRSPSVSILQTIMTGLKKLSMVGRTQQSMECKSLGSSLSTVAEESAHTKQAQHKQSCEESQQYSRSFTEKVFRKKHKEQQKESSSITSSASRHFRDPTQPHPPTESQQKSRSFLEKDSRKNPEEQHKENCSVSPSARRRHSSLDQESSIHDSDYLLQRRDTIEERDLRRTTSIIEILDHARHSLRRQSSSSPNPPKPSCQYFAGFASYYYRHHSQKSKLSSPAHKSMVTKTVSPEPGHFGESTANSKTPSKESDRQSVTSKTPSHDSCSVTSRISSFSSNVSFHLPNVRAVAFEPSFEGQQTSFTCPLLVLSQSAPQAQKYDTLTEENLRQEQTLQLEKNKKSTMKGQQNEGMRQSTGVDFTDSDKSHLSEILEKSQKTPDHLPGTTKTSPQSQSHDLLVVEKPAPRHGSDRVTSGRSSPSSSHQGCQPTSIRALLSCVTSPFTKGRNSSTGGKYTGANRPSRYPDAKMAVKKRSSRSTGEVGSPSHQRHPPLPGGNTLTDYRHPPLSGGSGPTDCEQMHPKATSSTCVVEHTSSSNWQSIEGSHSVDHGRQSSKTKFNIQEHNPCKGYLSSQPQLNQQENEGTMSQSPQHNLPMGNAAKTQEQRSIKAKKKEPPSNRKQKPLFNGEKQLQKTKRLALEDETILFMPESVSAAGSQTSRQSSKTD